MKVNEIPMEKEPDDRIDVHISTQIGMERVELVVELCRLTSVSSDCCLAHCMRVV